MHKKAWLESLRAWAVLFGATVATATALAATTPGPTAQQLDNLAQLGQKNLDALKAPEYAESRCMLSPVFGADYVSIAVSSDRVFYAGDVVVSIAGQPLDRLDKHTVRDVLSNTRAR